MELLLEFVRLGPYARCWLRLVWRERVLYEVRSSRCLVLPACFAEMGLVPVHSSLRKVLSVAVLVFALENLAV
jgi:hypothetical protein